LKQWMTSWKTCIRLTIPGIVRLIILWSIWWPQ